MQTQTKQPPHIEHFKKISLASAIFICTLAALPYFYEFFLQIAPSVMANEWMRAFSVDAAGLGAIAAGFYYAYTPMQLPAGILLDRFGPRRLLTIATLFCAVGTLLLASTSSASMATLGRFSTGIGGAFTFISILLLSSRWFPASYFALLAGLAQLMGSSGALFSEAPLAAANSFFGWRPTLLATALIGFLIAFVIWFCVKDFPPGHQQEQLRPSHRNEWKNLKAICSSAQTWYTALYAFTIWSPITIFAALWGVPFLMAKYPVNETLAGSACDMIWMGTIVGSPLVGWWSDRVNRRCSPLGYSALLGLAVSLIVLYLDVPFSLMYVLLFLYGVAVSGQALSFGLVRDNNHPSRVGTAIGFNNMATVAGGALITPVVGTLIAHYWNGTLVNGVHIYPLIAYQATLLSIPLCFFFAFLLSTKWIKETHCQLKYTGEEAAYD